MQQNCCSRLFSNGRCYYGVNKSFDHAVLFLLQEELTWYGIDWSGPVSSMGDNEDVVIPIVHNPLSSHMFDVLQGEIDPTVGDVTECYIATRIFVHAYASN